MVLPIIMLRYVTDNYVKIRAPWNPELVNTIHQVKLESIDQEGFVRAKLKMFELS